MSETLKRYAADHHGTMREVADGPYYSASDIDPILKRLEAEKLLLAKLAHLCERPVPISDSLFNDHEEWRDAVNLMRSTLAAVGKEVGDEPK